MDKFETDSDYSIHSDSFLSNASSLSGLSFYENEFTELRHLVNPNKYPTPPLDRSLTPKPNNECPGINERIISLQNELQNSLELNIRFKNELGNVEREIELKFHDKIEKLIKNNAKLEGQLQNANNQIQRLIKNYANQNECIAFKEKLELERKIQELTIENNKLERECAIVRNESENINLENKNFKINLGECITELDITKGTNQNLKSKISEQHVEIQNFLKENATLCEKINILSAKLENSDKVSSWYKEQLLLSQNDKQNSDQQIIKHKNEISDLHEEISNLNIALSKSKCEVDEVRFQALKEKEALYAKLENINVNLEITSREPNITLDEVDFKSYTLTIEDLTDEITKLKKSLDVKDEQLIALKKENSELLSKYLILQKSNQQTENIKEMLESTRKDLVKQLEYLNENFCAKQAENLQLKNNVLSLEVELKRQNQEKKSVEASIQVIRSQFYNFQKNYEKLKQDLTQKNKDIFELQKDRQELFMKNSWATCELEKTKKKDFANDGLKKEISNLETKLLEHNKNITDLRFQVLQKEKVIDEKEAALSEKQKELENYDLVLIQYKTMHSDYENKVNSLQINLSRLEDNEKSLKETLKAIKEELQCKELKLNKVIERKKQIKIDFKKNIDELNCEKENILKSNKNSEEKYKTTIKEKEKLIQELQKKINSIESDYGMYLKRNTDDHKVELLNMINNDKFFGIIMEKLNVDELQNSVNIKLKHLDEKMYKGYNECQEIRQKIIDKEEKIKELELVIKVKDREMLEKQKKMDRNNRTLLRKLKEHMRGRNSAEKQLKYLQDLYNSLSDKHNTLALSEAAKNCSIVALEELCQKYKTECEKAKEVNTTLERKLSDINECKKCFDFEIIQNKFIILQQAFQQLQDSNKNIESQLIESKGIIKALNNQFQEKVTEVNNLSRNIEEYKKVLEEFENKEKEYKEQSNSNKELIEQINDNEMVIAKLRRLTETLKRQLEDSKENNYFLTTQIEDLSYNLQQKVEYLVKIEDSKTSIEKRLVKETAEYQDSILQLKKDILLFKNEIENLQNEKFFLQRLSNDLKIALNSYAGRNKTLQEQLDFNLKSTEKVSNLSSVALNDFTISGKYDERYINQLLTENKGTSLQKPVTSEIQGCLRMLKDEIFNLQGEITRKNQVQ